MSSKDEFEKHFEKTFKIPVTRYNLNNSQTRFYSTGVISLDIASGIGGFPQGRVIEIFGPESGGKSLIALQAIAHAQKKYNLPSMYMDLEGATPPDWLEALGIDLEKLTIISADPDLYAEKALDIIIEVVKANIYAYIVVDSVVGLVPEKEMSGSIEDNTMGLLSRKMAQALKKLVPTVKDTKTCVIFINQIREKIGVMFGNPETTPGGKALKFYAAQRYRITKKSQSEKKVKGNVVGHTVLVKNKKNKLGPPLREGEFSLHYTKGTDNLANLIKVGKNYSVIKKDGQSYAFVYVSNDEEIMIQERGLQKFTDVVAGNDEIMSALYDACIKAFFEGKTEISEDAEIDEEFDI